MSMSLMRSNLRLAPLFKTPQQCLPCARIALRTPPQLGGATRFSTQARVPSRTVYQVATGLGLGISLLVGGTGGKIYCEPSQPTNTVNAPPAAPFAALESLPPPPQSSVNMYELSFGTVAGLCAGVFVKKGAKAVAFVLGGVFVLLQYFGSLSLIRVDWVRMSSRFENLFYRTDALGVRRAPTPGSLLRWLVDFLTADFQPRATFIAGFALGLRLG